ncbi:hypothetical protein [Clostridium tunisiense]|uniref:hypothetical protein n=1 Tax=Clostridium tunisiense TaxID=219748 RepID=UPI00037B8FA6|nr:hypothetical protein [Clostridium tunisiense]
MEKKVIKLSQQYFVNMLIFLLILLSLIVSRSSFIAQEYKSIFMWVYNIVLTLGCFMVIFKHETVDESAEKVLNRVNNIIWLVIRIGLLVLAVVVGAPMFKEKIDLSRDAISVIILLFLFLLTFLKYILFVYYDRKGL